MGTCVHREHRRRDPQGRHLGDKNLWKLTHSHQLANLQSLAVYFNTDSPSMAGLPPNEAKKKFSDLVKLIRCKVKY